MPHRCAGCLPQGSRDAAFGAQHVPQVLAVDELGTQEDCQAVEEALHCGCRILGTMHLGGMEEWKDKAYLSQWIERGFFERFVFLQSGAGGKREFSVYDGKRQKLC